MNTKGPIQAMFFHHSRDSLVVVTKTNFVLRFDAEVGSPNKFNQTVRFKLSTGPSEVPNEPTALSVAWMGAGMLATAGNEGMVRVWGLDDDENYVLPSSLWNPPPPEFGDEDGSPGAKKEKKKGGKATSSTVRHVSKPAYLQQRQLTGAILF
jgi:hypothetical protein